MSQNGAVGPSHVSPGNRGAVQLFGITATGSKFVYVVDRSGRTVPNPQIGPNTFEKVSPK